jgi:hypothetical protein
MVEAYPLHWPAGYPRSNKQKDSRFTTTLGKARDFVKEEIKRLKGKNPIISTDIPLKNDGDLRADWSRYKLDDTGVAVYFDLDGKQVCLCCDSYKKVWDNLHAIGRTIAALRQIDRDGVSDFLNRAFQGFKALPAAGESTTESCWDVLQMNPTKNGAEITAQYKKLAFKLHPDQNSGDSVKMAILNVARKQATDYANTP